MVSHGSTAQPYEVAVVLVIAIQIGTDRFQPLPAATNVFLVEVFTVPAPLPPQVQV